MNSIVYERSKFHLRQESAIGIQDCTVQISCIDILVTMTHLRVSKSNKENQYVTNSKHQI